MSTTQQGEETELETVLVSSRATAGKHYHKPTGGGDVACQTVLRDDNSRWIPKTMRQAIFCEPCKRCFEQEEDA